MTNDQGEARSRLQGTMLLVGGAVAAFVLGVLLLLMLSAKPAGASSLLPSTLPQRASTAPRVASPLATVGQVVGAVTSPLTGSGTPAGTATSATPAAPTPSTPQPIPATSHADLPAPATEPTTSTAGATGSDPANAAAPSGISGAASSATGAVAPVEGHALDTSTRAVSAALTPVVDGAAPTAGTTLGSAPDGLSQTVGMATRPALGLVATLAEPAQPALARLEHIVSGQAGSALGAASGSHLGQIVPTLTALAPSVIGHPDGVVPSLAGGPTAKPVNDTSPSVRRDRAVLTTLLSSEAAASSPTATPMAPAGGGAPSQPGPAPSGPFSPASTLAVLDASPGAGMHSGNSGLLPPMGMVLAVLVACGVVLACRRRPVSWADGTSSRPG